MNDPVLPYLVKLLKTLDATKATIRFKPTVTDEPLVQRVQLEDDTHRVTVARKDTGHYELTLEKDHGDGSRALHIYPCNVVADSNTVWAEVKGAYRKHKLLIAQG